MAKAKNLSLWTEEGYSLFASEGLDGLQVERLSRILQLNKSGFYHYFGDLEMYCAEIIKLHNKKVDHFLQDVGESKTLDPDYLLLLIKHAPVVMFQVQLIRKKNSHLFYQTSEAIDRKVNLAVQQLWSDFLGVPGSPDLAMRYYFIVRDMFYMRISFENLTYTYLHDLVMEARQLVIQLAHHQPNANNLVKH